MNHTRKFLAVAFGLVLLFVVLPLLYGLVLMLLVVLPPICLGVTVKDAITARVAARETAERLFIALIGLPLLLLTALAPMRALLVGVFGFFPAAYEKFNEPHEFFLWPVAAATGEFFPYWLDLYWGVYGVLAIFVLALLDSMRRSLLTRQIGNLATAKARSVAVGLAELSGRAVPAPGASSTEPIIRIWYERSGKDLAHRTRADRFYLDDGTGLMLIDPAGATVGLDTDAASFGMHQVKLKAMAGGQGMDVARLMPGDAVFVVGSVQINDDEATRQHDPVVIKPKGKSLLRPNFYDVFFLGNGGEQALLSMLRKSVRHGWGAVVILMLLTGWLAVHGYTNIVQMKTLNVEAVPAPLRLLTPAPVMERRLPIAGLGTHTVAQWLDRLQGDGGDKHAILERLHRARLARLAIPALLEHARDIDHPDFGVSNHWLMALGALPQGHWGYAYYGREFEAKGGTVVYRVRLRRDGARLLASYDVHFNVSQPINARVTARRVLLILKEATTGQVHTVQLDAEPGWNRARDLEIFADLPRGKYRFHIQARREFGNGLYDREALPVQEVTIVL